MSFGKRLSERTSAIEVDPARAATKANESPRTSPGRMFEAQSLVNQAEQERDAAKLELSEARKRIEELETGAASAGAVDIDIDTLVEVPGRRRVLSKDEYEELRANLASNRLVHPVVYLPLEGGKNEIISGHNRVAIYRDDLKRDRIRAIPFNGTRVEAELGAAFSNLLAPSLPDFEKYRQFQRMQELCGLTRQDIIKASGLSQSHIARILAFDGLPEEARAIIAKRPDRIGANAAEGFAALVKAGHVESVTSALQRLVEDDSMTQERALALAKPKADAPPRPETLAVNIGKRKLCEVTSRASVVAVRFSGKDGEAKAGEWSRRIHEFIQRLAEEEGKA